jgi:hypothetical protein
MLHPRGPPSHPLGVRRCQLPDLKSKRPPGGSLVSTVVRRDRLKRKSAGFVSHVREAALPDYKADTGRHREQCKLSCMVDGL